MILKNLEIIIKKIKKVIRIKLKINYQNKYIRQTKNDLSTYQQR
jgi:hypothetical protein